MGGIVVGLDGSPDAYRALEWAMREAVCRHAPLKVLAVHEVAASIWTGAPITFETDTDLVEHTRKAAEDLVAKAAAKLDEPSSVTVTAVSGVPARELIDASRSADLMVVGSRGVGGFSQLMLGSVSNQVVHHARCPVVVLPREG